MPGVASCFFVKDSNNISSQLHGTFVWLSLCHYGVTQTNPPPKLQFTTGNTVPEVNSELFALPAALKRSETPWTHIVMKAANKSPCALRKPGILFWKNAHSVFEVKTYHGGSNNSEEKSLDTQASVFLSADRSNRLIAEVSSNIWQIRPKWCGVLTPPTQQATWVLEVKLQPSLF